MQKLSKYLPNVVSEEDADQLDNELRNYQIDPQLNDKNEKGIAEFWSAVLSMKEDQNVKYPILSKMIKAVLTCFQVP